MYEHIIKKVQNQVELLFENESTGHDFHHINRVRKLALHIARIEGGNLEKIEFAALLHDISDYKFNGGDETLGGKETFEILRTHNLPDHYCIEIKTIVDSVSFKGANVSDKSTSLEAKIVQDADRLDALGAIGIARTFAYGGSSGNPIYDPKISPVLHDTFDAYKNGQTHTINHFYEKLLLLKDKLHTETAKQIAEHRHTIMENYLSEFYKEWNVEL